MKQAVRVIGEICLGRDTQTFHEETFTCRRLFLMTAPGTGEATYTSRIHIRHVAHPPGYVLSARDLSAFFQFLRFIRKVPPSTRHKWLLPQDRDCVHARSFRWASNGSNEYITITVRNDALLVILANDYQSGRDWLQVHSAAEPSRHTVSWF